MTVVHLTQIDQFSDRFRDEPERTLLHQPTFSTWRDQNATMRLDIRVGGLVCPSRRQPRRLGDWELLSRTQMFPSALLARSGAHLRS